MQAIKDLIRKFRGSYARVFDLDGDKNGDVQAVLDDLMKFCHFGDTAFHPNQRVTDLVLGRQEVLMRILAMSRLSADELYEKYTREKFNPRKPE